jgi:hypothetical protein
VTPLDRTVERVRRRVERALPWFDASDWRHERTRQARIVARAFESEERGRAVIEEYRRVERLRR